jgi:hypothetical protein
MVHYRVLSHLVDFLNRRGPSGSFAGVGASSIVRDECHV